MNNKKTHKDWLFEFEAKAGMGAVICEGPEIHAVLNELTKLREENERLRSEIRQ